MAPSRRKGASKAAAAAAAAACRQWKVGDLVLAKLKGFPAWPATVSEPEKWGYSADWKKVLVYFFGTQQIAFCNPADVEAFTEEKKQSLLTKRHGKGSDFVRAVHEIIDSYENLKKQDKGINAQSSNEVTLTNTTKSMESLADSGLNDEAPASTVEPCPKSSDSTRADKDPGFFPIKGDGAATQNDALHDKRTISENPTGNFVVTEAPLPNTYSRKKVGGIQAQKFVTQKRAPSARRSRSSSRVESRRFQNFISPSNNIAKSPGNVAASLLRDGSIRRAKRIRKSPDVSEVHDTHSPALVSNSCLEENGSEIVTVDSDTHSLNDGSTVESGYNMMRPESAECCEGDVELSLRLHFQAKSVVVKKKRKPSRKRASNGATELTGRVNKDAGVETELHKSGEVKPSDLEKSNGRYSKEDGDEHLPLVKRARVRMSRPSSTGEEADALIKAEVKSSGVSNSCLGHVSPVLDCEEDSPVDGKSVVVKGHAYDSSPSNKSPVNKPPLWEVKKQQHASSVDVEAALPPSKRLHRALEAMSANAAEHGQTSSEVPSTMKMFSNGCSSSFTRDCSNISAENTARSEFGVQNKDAFNNDVTQECTSGFSSNLNPPIVEESAKSFVNLVACHKPVEVDNSSEHVFCEDVPVEAVNSADATSLDTHVAETVVVAQSPKPVSPQLGSQQALSECSQSLLRLTLPSNDSKIENCELRHPCKEDDPSEIPRMSLEPVSGSMEIATRSPQNDTSLHLYVAQSNSETTKLSMLPPAENNQDNGVFDVVKETKTTLKDSNVTPSPTTEEVAIAAVHGAHISNSSSLSEDHLSHHKAVPGIRSSSSPTEGLDSTACASPPNTSICIMSTSDNCNLLENNGCCSPDVRLHHEKPKHATKSSNRGEANAALTSFEASLGTLTRTKESIGRATRSAIECAKFGIAPKVVEVIARNLESEPSLHRRVDLFFLVDSITQCSRGLKGDAGGIYPSAIQAKLPRLLLAAAPPGSSALENRRQCLKVLRLWQERRILPESVIRRHIRDLDSLSNSSSAGAFSRRPLRTERAFDDPLREMEGMVDEYGSNSSFQLPGFRMPPMVKDGDDGSDSDGGNFEAVTPEHNSENTEERGWARTPAAATEKRSHILEDVDGELEMEDVAPCCETEMSSTSNVAAVNTLETSHQQQHFPPPFAPPLPKDVPPSSPPLPTSPPPPRPPPPPPPPSLPPPSALPDPITNNLDSRLYVGIHNIKEDPQQCTIQQSVAPSINPTVPDAFHYHAPPENRDPQRLMQMSESVNSCSISNLHVVSHQPVRPVNSVQQLDGAALHHKAFHLPPPHPAPSNQFSYVQADQQVQSRREIPLQSYPHQFHYVPNTDTGNFYSDHDRMKLAPHDISENWRFSAPPPGPCYPESSGLPYAHAAYAGPPCEPAPAIPSHSWSFPPPPMNHREPIPHRPPSEGPIPVAVRAPNFWRPR